MSFFHKPIPCSVLVKLHAKLISGDGFKYAGVGSRGTPHTFRGRMYSIAKTLGAYGAKLTSGAASGPDTWFEMGQIAAYVEKYIANNVVKPDYINPNHFKVPDGLDYNAEIFIPWPTFSREERVGRVYYPIGDTELGFASEVLKASGVCPWISKLKQGVFRLFCRNVYQILSLDLDKVDCVIYWAPENREKGTVAGGTRIAVYLARYFDIPCFNLAFEEDARQLDYVLFGEDSTYAKTLEVIA